MELKLLNKEDRKYTDLTPLIESEFELVSSPGTVSEELKKQIPLGNTIVFVDGYYSEELSNVNYEVIDRDTNIIHIATKEAENTSDIVITAKDCKLFEMFVGKNKYFTNNKTKIKIEGRVEHVRVQNESSEAFSFSNTEVEVPQDAHYKSVIINLGGRLSRNNLNVNLIGKNASTELYGLFKPTGQNDNYTKINHLVGNTKSKQLYKGILDGKSVGVFNGIIKVERDASGVDSSQLNKNLLLSKEAKVHTKPQLEIDNDDVKCAHGATTGQIDEDGLFYLQSRGISREKAIAMLIDAFADDVLSKISDSELRNKVARLLK